MSSLYSKKCLCWHLKQQQAAASSCENLLGGSCGWWRLVAVAGGGWLLHYLGLFILTLGKKSPTSSSTAPTAPQHHGCHGCMYSGGTHIHTTGVGPGWLPPYVRDLENGRFQKQQQASPQNLLKNEGFRPVLLRQARAAAPYCGYR